MATPFPGGSASCYLSQHPPAFQKDRHACAGKRPARWRSPAPITRPGPRPAGCQQRGVNGLRPPVSSAPRKCLAASWKQTHLLMTENTSSFGTHFLPLYGNNVIVCRPGSLFYRAHLKNRFRGKAALQGGTAMADSPTGRKHGHFRRLNFCQLHPLRPSPLSLPIRILASPLIVRRLEKS